MAFRYRVMNPRRHSRLQSGACALALATGEPLIRARIASSRVDRFIVSSCESSDFRITPKDAQLLIGSWALGVVGRWSLGVGNWPASERKLSAQFEEAALQHVGRTQPRAVGRRGAGRADSERPAVVEHVV